MTERVNAVMESECLEATIERYQDDSGGVTTRPPSSVPEVERLLEANSPGSTPISMPVSPMVPPTSRYRR